MRLLFFFGMCICLSFSTCMGVHMCIGDFTSQKSGLASLELKLQVAVSTLRQCGCREPSSGPPPEEEQVLIRAEPLL